MELEHFRKISDFERRIAILEKKVNQLTGKRQRAIQDQNFNASIVMKNECAERAALQDKAP